MVDTSLTGEGPCLGQEVATFRKILLGSRLRSSRLCERKKYISLEGRVIFIKRSSVISKEIILENFVFIGFIFSDN